MALTSLNIDDTLKAGMKETALLAAKQMGLSKLSLNDLTHKMHEHFKATYLED